MKKRLLKLLAILSILPMFIFSAPVLADCSGSAQQAIQCGANGAAGTSQSASNASSNLEGTIKNVVNVLSTLVGVVAVIMIIIAGFRYITSGGKQESVASAKNTVLYAIIGLVVVALAQVIVHFVLSKTS